MVTTMMFFNNKVCPRCGKEFAYIEQRRQNDRVYFYAVHVIKEKSGKRKIRKCYLGPLTYEYVTRLHQKENLTFKGLLEANRTLEYLEAILQSLLNGSLDPELRKRLAEKLRFYADLLEKT